MIKPEAVLFDLDGVLCDTSEYHFWHGNDWLTSWDFALFEWTMSDLRAYRGSVHLRSFWRSTVDRRRIQKMKRIALPTEKTPTIRT